MSWSGATLADWLARIETFSPREVDLGLERVCTLLDRLDLRLPATVLHVAGTNGKGSSVAYAAALLARTGAVVGAYTSPHMLDYNERINVAGAPAADADIVAAFERIESLRGDLPLTYFEYGTIAALAVFDARGVEIAILEVGMGGRLDAVNAVESSAGLITNIALDHCDWLGDDIETIAAEKAGIMRTGKPIVFASRDVPRAIERRAAELDADLRLAGQDFDWHAEDGTWRWRGREHVLEALQKPPLDGKVQLDNASGVLALVEAAGYGDLLEPTRVNAAFGGVRLQGRMQSERTDRRWLFDVAHNPAAAATLAATLAGQQFSGRTIAIIGALDDKDVAGIVSPLAAIVDKWIGVRANSPRAIAVDELARQIANVTNKGCLEAESIGHAIVEARRVSDAEDRVIVTGSFYVVGPALEALGLYSPR